MIKSTSNEYMNILKEWGCDTSSEEAINNFMAENEISVKVGTDEDKFIKTKYHAFTSPNKKYNAVFMVERTQKNAEK